MSCTNSRGRALLVSLVVLFSLLGLVAFLASPWHQHSRVSTQPCPYSSFEHASWTGVTVAPAAAPPPAEAPMYSAAGEARPAEQVFAVPAPVRAPPKTLALA